MHENVQLIYIYIYTLTHLYLHIDAHIYFYCKHTYNYACICDIVTMHCLLRVVWEFRSLSGFTWGGETTFDIPDPRFSLL